MSRSENKKDQNSVQARAGRETVVFLKEWKRQVRRMRIYRISLCVALFFCFAFLLAY